MIKELWINFDSNGSWKITITKDAHALDLVKEIVYCYGYGVMNLHSFLDQLTSTIIAIASFSPITGSRTKMSC